MFPIVSNRAPPTGHLFRSILLAFLCSQIRRTLLPMSKIESIPVASKERDSDDIAAYTASMLEETCLKGAGKIRTLEDT